ncbi:ATP-binding protein [Streptomyces sp. FB2]|uniref:ATP-binding protein n=1 Tax=Streptomyces TaxID=1883 RepID=UPI001F195399|nr:ATP-binding protein [Streptomyces sp. FB2]MCF2536818.1 ATP-binding protein [Streptomyces sp. FB2]
MADTGEDGGTRTGNRVDIDGDATGPVIAGNYNVVVDAQHGSTVTVLMDGQRPRPRRRDRIRLLPRRQGTPLGRDADLAAIAAALHAGESVQLWGPPGVGKSALLRHAARTLDAGGDGVVFLDAARREPEDLAQDIFEACHSTGGYAPSRGELPQLMEGVEATVYVDNADYTAEQLRTVMDAAPDALFVFAGREEVLQGTDGRAHRVEGITRDAAAELLTRELGGAGDPDLVTALWEAAAGAPLLLLRAAAVARLDPAAGLPRPGAVRELLHPLFDRLDEPSLRALHLLGTFRDAELDPEHIGALSGTPDAAALCAGLAGLGLAEETELGYRVADGVVAALRERRGLRPYALERLCGYFADWAARPETPAAQVAGHARALEVLAELAERSGRADLAVRVVRAASPALARSLRFGVWGRLLDQGLPAAQRAGDRQAEAYFTHERGVRAVLTGNRVVAAVLLAEAGILWRQLGDTQGADAAANAQQYVPQEPGPEAGSPDAGSPDGPGEVNAPEGGGSDVGSSSTDPTPLQDPTAGTAPSAPSPEPAPPPETGASMPTDPGATAPDMPTVPSDPGMSGGGMPVDPGTAASPATGVPPTGIGEAGGAVAASAGAGGAGAAIALKVAAVIAAVVIGAVAVEQNRSSSESASDTPAVSAPTPTVEFTAPADPVDATTDEPEPEPTGLAGTWNGSDGGTYVFTDAGLGTYTMADEDGCGNPTSTEFTGSGDTYSATAPGYAREPCDLVLGQIRTTITLGEDGDTAEVTQEVVSVVDRSARCTTCQSFTLTRAS